MGLFGSLFSSNKQTSQTKNVETNVIDNKQIITTTVAPEIVSRSLGAAERISGAALAASSEAQKQASITTRDAIEKSLDFANLNTAITGRTTSEIVGILATSQDKNLGEVSKSFEKALGAVTEEQGKIRSSLVKVTPEGFNQNALAIAAVIALASLLLVGTRKGRK